MNKLYIVIMIQFIIILIFASINVSIVLKNDKLNKSPLLYSAELYDINFCSCYTEGQGTFYFNKTSIWQTIKRMSSPEYIFNLNAG